MAMRVVQHWLEECKTFTNRDLVEHSKTVRGNEDLVEALYETVDDETTSTTVLARVCHQLFQFYKSEIAELKKLCLELIPVFVETYLRACSCRDRKRCSSVEACLLGIYNMEVVDTDGAPRVKSYTVPTLAAPSIYHEPPSIASLALTENNIQRFHCQEAVTVTVDPLPQVDVVTSQNRHSILAKIICEYGRDVINLSKRSWLAFCKMASRICKTGFESVGDLPDYLLNASISSAGSDASRGSGRTRSVGFQEEPRIQLQSKLLVEIVDVIYFIMFNGMHQEAIAALEDVETRASYELYADVLLLSNAIKNSLLYNPSGRPEDGPIGVSVTLSPAALNPSFKKHAITNASFKIKKLPDDIPPSSPDHSPPRSPVEGRKESLVFRKDSFKKLLPRSLNLRRLSPSSRDERVTSMAQVVLKVMEQRRRNKQHSVFFQDDIDAIADDDDAVQNPPRYDDVMDGEAGGSSAKPEAEKSRGTTTRMGKPLKSIMKLKHAGEDLREKISDRMERMSMVRKASESGRSRDDASPKHPPTQPGNPGNDSAAVDASMVTVSVVRSGSRDAPRMRRIEGEEIDYGDEDAEARL